MSVDQPFSDFLLFLRTRGIAIGVTQFQDLARLCQALPDEFAQDRQLLSRCLAGLLATNAEEQDKIEELFFVHYAEAFREDAEVQTKHKTALQQGLFPQEVKALKQPARRRWKRAVAGFMFCVLLMGVSGLSYWKWFARPEPESIPPTEIANKSHTAENPPDPGPSVPEEMPPDVGEPLRLFHLEQALWVVLPGPVFLFGVVFVLLRRRELRQFAKKYWRARRNDQGGAQFGDLEFGRFVGPALNRDDLEDMATVLGRSDDKPSSRALDGERTVTETVQRGGLPTLVYVRRPLARTVLVLSDVSSDMLLWKRKTDELMDGLRTRGVPLVVYFFDGDAEFVSEQPFGHPVPLSDVVRLFPDAGLLVLSAGVGVPDRDDPTKRADWLGVCERISLRVWLHPVLNRKVWRKSLQKRDFPLRVLPMSRNGMLAAAYELAQEKEHRRHIARATSSTERDATEKDKERLLQLLSLWPDAPLSLADYLRQKFCEGMPEETLLHVLAESEDLSGTRLVFSEETLCKQLNALQTEDAKWHREADLPQRLEERVRRDFVDLLLKHEPRGRDTIEHLQWRLRVAMQKLYLHDADDRNVKEAIATLQELAQGVLWEDVVEALAPLGVPLSPSPKGRPSRPLAAPVQKKLQKEVLGLVKQTAGGRVRVPGSSAEVKTEGVSRPFVSWAATRAALPMVCFGLLLLLLVGKLNIGWETRSHVEAYRIERHSLLGTESPLTDLVITTQKDDVPLVVLWCGESPCAKPLGTLTLPEPARQGQLSEKGGLKQTVERGSLDRLYHVRARLKNGVWGYSKQVLVAGYKPPPTGELVARFVSEQKEVPGVRFWVTDASGKTVEGESGKRLSLRAGAVTVFGERAPFGRFEQTAEVKVGGLGEVTIDLGRPPPPINMVDIPAGRFRMGSNDGDDDEKPVHVVTLPAFYLDVYEVTLEEYGKCVRAGGCSALEKTVKWERYSEEDVKKWSPFCNVNQRGRGRHPVNCVDWNQAAVYCKWARKRLPTEEEWEYAARGTDGRKYPWGNEAPRTGLLNACGSECADMAKNKGLGMFLSMYSGNDGWETTAPMGSVEGDKSPFGVMNLGGNVTEWVQDAYRPGYRTSDGSIEMRSLRGASWNSNDLRYARAPNRFRLSPVNRFNDVGFRCARTK